MLDALVQFMTQSRDSCMCPAVYLILAARHSGLHAAGVSLGYLLGACLLLIYIVSALALALRAGAKWFVALLERRGK